MEVLLGTMSLGESGPNCHIGGIGRNNKGCAGSGWTRIGALVEVVFSRLNACWASGDQVKVVSLQRRAVNGAVWPETPEIKHL